MHTISDCCQPAAGAEPSIGSPFECAQPPVGSIVASFGAMVNGAPAVPREEIPPGGCGFRCSDGPWLTGGVLPGLRSHPRISSPTEQPPANENIVQVRNSRDFTAGGVVTLWRVGSDEAAAKESWRGRFESSRDSWNGISHGRASKRPPASTRPPFGSSSDKSTLPTTAPTRSFHAEGLSAWPLTGGGSGLTHAVRAEYV